MYQGPSHFDQKQRHSCPQVVSGIAVFIRMRMSSNAAHNQWARRQFLRGKGALIPDNPYRKAVSNHILCTLKNTIFYAFTP